MVYMRIFNIPGTFGRQCTQCVDIFRDSRTLAQRLIHLIPGAVSLSCAALQAKDFLHADRGMPRRWLVMFQTVFFPRRRGLKVLFSPIFLGNPSVHYSLSSFLAEVDGNGLFDSSYVTYLQIIPPTLP